MQPLKTLTSPAELTSLTAMSIVCPVGMPDYLMMATGQDSWQEPYGDPERAVPSAKLWEWMTGHFFTQIHGNGRELWLLWDAGDKSD